MMAHLGVLQEEHSDAVSKYLEDHPDPRARVAHLMGYPELDPATVTPAQELVQASSDEERARYDFARLRLDKSSRPIRAAPKRCSSSGNPSSRSGLPNKSEQTLAEAAQLGIAGDPRDRQSAHRGAAPDGSAAHHPDQAEPAQAAGMPWKPRRPRTSPNATRDSGPRAAKVKISSRPCRAGSRRFSTKFPISAGSTSGADRESKRS